MLDGHIFVMCKLLPSIITFDTSEEAMSPRTAELINSNSSHHIFVKGNVHGLAILLRIRVRAFVFMRQIETKVGKLG